MPSPRARTPVFCYRSYLGCRDSLRPAPENWALVPGCVLGVELRRVCRLRIGCSIMDGSSILQYSNTFHPRIRGGTPVKRMKKDPPSGNIRPKHAGGEVPRNRAPVPGFVARPEAVTACGCWLACASIPVKRIRTDTHQELRLRRYVRGRVVGTCVVSGVPLNTRFRLSWCPLGSF